MISKENISAITDACRIEEVVGDFMGLKKRGSGFLGICPFHHERTPSFHVSPSRGIFKCFGCGKGGDSITFVMQHENISYPDALRYLAGKYGIQIDETEQSSEERLQGLEKESLYIVNKFAQEYFAKNLLETEEGKSIGLAYFSERGFRREQIESFGLGYSMKAWDAFLNEAKSKGHNEEMLLKAGLVRKNEKGTFDFFRERVIFPIHNIAGKVIAFGARILTKDPRQPKYVNSPETDIYSKAKTLYGFFQAKNEIRKQDKVFLVEGYTDVISMHMAGIENVVASSGTSLTVEQVRLIKRFTNNITILYDGDSAGIKAALRGLEMAIEEDMNLRIVLLPDGEDPDSFVQKNGAAKFNSFVQSNEKNFIRFKTDLLLNEAKFDPLKRAEVVHEIVETIARVPDMIKRSFFVKECSTVLEINEQILILEVNKAIRKNGRNEEMIIERRTAEPQKKEYAIEPQERDIIRLLLEYGKMKLDDDMTVAEAIASEFEKIEFKNELYNAILNIFKQQIRQGNQIDRTFFDTCENLEIRELVFEIAEGRYEISPNWEKKGIVIPKTADNFLKDITSSIRMYQINRFRQMKSELLAELKLAETEEEQTKIQTKYMRVQGSLKTLSQEMGATIFGRKLIESETL